MKVILNPMTGFALTWRIKVMSEMPSAKPTILNVPLSPTMVATFSGINSIQALFTAGVVIPEPMPEIRTTNDSIHALSR